MKCVIKPLLIEINPTSTLCVTILVGIASGERWNSSVSIVTGLHAGRQRTIGLTPGRRKIYISSPKFPERLCGPFGLLLIGYRGIFP